MFFQKNQLFAQEKEGKKREKANKNKTKPKTETKQLINKCL